jgi:hypothetical protein
MTCPQVVIGMAVTRDGIPVTANNFEIASTRPIRPG